jgi:carboxyl-terminal processing protease
MRANELPPPVASRMLDGHIGLLSIYSLAASAPEQAQVKLKTLISAGAQKIILDLRDCADGEPGNGAELANFFLKSGVIYTSKGQSEDALLEVKASADKFVTDLPLAVLINGSTAGPAEIVAGSLKGNGRASLIGERTFGIGSSQKRFQLKSGGVLVLSTAKYYTPDGKMIQDDVNLTDTGLKPDVEAPDKDRLEDLLVDAYFNGQDDAAKYKQLQEKLDQEQLNKAVEILSKGGAVVKKAA